MIVIERKVYGESPFDTLNILNYFQCDELQSIVIKNASGTIVFSF